MVFVKVENFLERFLKLAPEDLSPKVEVILKKRFPKSSFSVKVKNKIIYLSNLSPALKNEIFLVRQDILKEAEDALGKKAPREISFQKS